MKADIFKIIVREKSTLKEVLGRMNKSNFNMLLIASNKKTLKGVLTYGDVRRAVHRGLTLDKTIEPIYNRQPKVAEAGWDLGKIKRLMNSKIKIIGGNIDIPIVNKGGKIVDVAISSKSGISFLSKTNLDRIGRVEKILVTGGAGYLGSVLVRKLLETGYTVRVLDNLTHGKDPLTAIWAHRNFDLIVGDILKIDDVVEAIRDVDAVVHLAAIVGDEASSLDPVKTINNNILATANIANACKKFLINRFIFASSCSVYGAGPSTRLLSEASSLLPASLYAYSKLESEIELARMSDSSFAPTILRFATLFGKSFRPRLDLVVNQMSAKAVHKKDIVVYGGNQWRPFLHCRDAAEAIVRVIESPISKVGGETFNVGSEKLNMTILDVAKKVILIVPHVLIKQEIGKEDPRNYRVSFNKIRKRLGFIPKITVEEGILEMVGDFKKNTYRNLGNRLTNSPTAAANLLLD